MSVGETAKLVWDYTVDNRSEEFDVFSPRWLFYADNGVAVRIAQESIFKNWEWYINRESCPVRLLNPVRVSKELNATLVIHNVTLADSGTYGCTLYLAKRSPIASKVKLVVTCTYTECFIIISNSSFQFTLIEGIEEILFLLLLLFFRSQLFSYSPLFLSQLILS